MSGLARKFAHVSGVPDTLALPRKAGASSAPAQRTASNASVWEALTEAPGVLALESEPVDPRL